MKSSPNDPANTRSNGPNLVSGTLKFTDRYKSHVLRGYTVTSPRPTGPKDIRARPVAAAAENGLLHIVRGRHINDFLDELTAFPHGSHDDCVDALSGAHTYLARGGGRRSSVHVPKGRIPIGLHLRRRALSDHELGAIFGATAQRQPER